MIETSIGECKNCREPLWRNDFGSIVDVKGEQLCAPERGTSMSAKHEIRSEPHKGN